jgi:RNA polymerase sigma-70 factor (ECF subfamily)
MTEREGAAPDGSLVARTLLGDASGFEELVRRYSDMLYRTAYRYTGDRDDSEDVVGETFCRAYERLREARGVSHIGPWLRTIATNLCLDGYRKRRYRSGRLEDLGRVSSGVSTELDPEGASLDEELRGRLGKALSQLSPRQRVAFMLFEVHGLDVREVAREMGCSDGTVKAQLHRARRRLRDLLGDYLDQGKEDSHEL